MRKRVKLASQQMWVCVVEDKYYHWETLSFKRKFSIDKMVQMAAFDFDAPDFEWQHLRNWGFKCVKVVINPELPCT